MTCHRSTEVFHSTYSNPPPSFLLVFSFISLFHASLKFIFLSFRFAFCCFSCLECPNPRSPHSHAGPLMSFYRFYVQFCMFICVYVFVTVLVAILALSIYIIAVMLTCVKANRWYPGLQLCDFVSLLQSWKSFY